MALLLKDVLNQFLDTNNDWRKRLFKDWAKIVGDLNKHMCLQKVYKSTIIVGVYESHWMQELYMLSRVIIKSINKHLGGSYVKYVRFKLIEPKQALKYGTNRSVTANKSYKPLVLSTKQKTLLGSLKDKELQHALKSFFSCCINNT